MPAPDKVTLFTNCNREVRLIEPALEMEVPKTENVPAVMSSEVAVPIVSVEMEVFAFSITGLLVVLEMVTTAELLLGAVLPVQFVPIVHRSDVMPVHVCAVAAVGQRQSSASKLDAAASTDGLIEKLFFICISL